MLTYPTAAATYIAIHISVYIPLASRGFSDTPVNGIRDMHMHRQSGHAVWEHVPVVRPR